MKTPTDSEKAAVWEAYHARNPHRVPLRWNVNPRIILLDRRLNPEGFTFEQYCHDPLTLMTVQSRFQEYQAQTLSQICDSPAQLPERWRFYVDTQNTADGAYFGAPVRFDADNCPSNLACLTEADVEAFLARDFSKPLENPWIRERLAFHAALTQAARDFTHAGRRGDVAPFSLGFDGPMTIAAVLMGEDIFALLGTEPEKAVRFMRQIIDAVLVRNRALVEHSGQTWKKAEWGGTADDSIQLIGTAMYEEHILPLHEFWYRATSDTTPASRKRSIHLCGDVSRHLPTLVTKLGVVSFDTGFPIDHGALRRALGPDVEISGGPHVGLLHGGTPEACFARTREILQSGIKEGGRFILQEANNLPPCCPLDNLSAVYAACLEFGRF
ncbi:MAG: uroporphyrinogen decarboxylase family protein [bacterium]